MPCFVLAAGHSCKLGQKGHGGAVVLTFAPGPKVQKDQQQ